MQEKTNLIEPDSALRTHIIGLLADRGVRVEPFASVEEFSRHRAGKACSVLLNEDHHDGVDLLHSLSSDGDWLAVIAYAEDPEPKRIVDLIRAGGYDFHALPLDAARIHSSLRMLEQGRTPYAALRKRAAKAAQTIERLSPREAEVLRAMSEGLSNKQIGLRLGISPRTVEIHRANMLVKLDAGTSTDALRSFFEATFFHGPGARPSADVENEA